MQKILTSPAALVVALVLAACGQSTSGGSRTASVTSDVLADTVAAANEATGTMLCAPSQDQITACTGLVAGDACALTSLDGQVSVAGVCRTTLDGVTLACGHVPPAPPPPLVEACASKAAGEACTVVEPDGDAHDGTCVTARDGATLVCGRAHVPPQAALDACAALAAGDCCTMTRLDGGAMTGVCSLGPAGTGALACLPPQALRPNATTACTGKVAGDACTLGSARHPVAGSCVTPAAGGDAVCQAACAAFGGPFRYGHGPGGMGPGMPPPPPPPAPALQACAALAAGDACTMTRLDGATVAGVCRPSIAGATVLVCAPSMAPGPIAPPPPPKPAIDACAALTAGAACTVTRLDGGTASGTCRLMPDPAGVLACVPTMMGR